MYNSDIIYLKVEALLVYSFIYMYIVSDKYSHAYYFARAYGTIIKNNCIGA